MIGQLEIHGQQIRGDRDYQEDVFQILELPVEDPVQRYLILADGMGGHDGGYEAASKAVSAVADYLKSELDTPKLETALQLANKAVAELHKNQPEFQDGGCTLVIARLSDQKLDWISVGDSPLYLISSGRVTRLNADHSMAPVLDDMVAAGRLTREEAENDPQRNALRSAITGDDLSLIDTSEASLNLSAGEVLLLASDGIDTLSHTRITEAVIGSAGRAKDICHNLIEAISEVNKPGQDNTSIINATLVAAQTDADTITRRPGTDDEQTVRIAQPPAPGPDKTSPPPSSSGRHLMLIIIALLMLGLVSVALFLLLTDAEERHNSGLTSDPMENSSPIEKATPVLPPGPGIPENKEESTPSAKIEPQPQPAPVTSQPDMVPTKDETRPEEFNDEIDDLEATEPENTGEPGPTLPDTPIEPSPLPLDIPPED